MKKLTRLGLCLLVTTSMLFGCGGKAETTETPSDDSTTVQSKTDGKGGESLSLYCNADDLAKPYMQKIISVWEEKTGNKIDQQGLETNNAETIALTKFTTGDIPDIYIHFGNSNLRNFNPEENFVDWSDAEWASDIQESIKSQTIFNGKIIGLPFWEASNSGCFYNKKIFDEYKIDIPKTQDEFNAVCEKLIENGVQPIYLAAADGWPVLYQFALDPVMVKHPEYVEKLNAGEITYMDIPEFRSMCEWFEMAGKKGYFGKNFASDTWDYTSEVLGTGEAAMMFVWDTWFNTDYDNENYEYKCDDFAIMPIFMGTCDEGTYEGGNVNLTMANKNGEKVELAKDFINFMADPENYNEAFKDVSTAAVFKKETSNKNSIQYDENKENVDRLINPSSAQPKIIGFNQSEGGKALLQLMSGDIDVDRCIEIIDNERVATLDSFAK